MNDSKIKCQHYHAQKMVIFYRKIEQSAFKYLMKPRLMMNKEKQILLFVVLLEAM